MRITVIGCGYVGLVTGACFTEMGNSVTCVDVNESRLAALRQGQIPIHEPGLEDIVRSALAARLLSFTSDIKQALNNTQYVFIAVGTPPREDGSVDMTAIDAVAKAIGQSMSNGLIVINKSTVPVGTADRVRRIIDAELNARGAHYDYHVVSNPEFLKEGTAVRDFMSPDRVVVGADNDDARRRMDVLYAPYLKKSDRLMFMGVREAEMTKYAANAMLATRISFMNELAELCDRTGVDVDSVRQGIGSDSRIGYAFLYPGCGYGGSCFPKDVQALMHTARDEGMEMRLLNEVEARNRVQKQLLFSKLNDYFAGDLKGKKVAVWGLAFKPGTDDMRQAPSVDLIGALLDAGASVAAYDPVAMSVAKRVLGEMPGAERLSLCDNQYEAVEQADALVLVTEWKRFRSPDFVRIKDLMRGLLIIDGRNQYDPDFVAELGFTYQGIGRSSRELAE